MDLEDVPIEHQKALKLYDTGRTLDEASRLAGVGYDALRHYCIMTGKIRSLSESRKNYFRSHRPYNWAGNDGSYHTQHLRAMEDYPLPLGLCELCCEKEATERLRVDHTTFSYHKELVILACGSCNSRHTFGGISISFVNPTDGHLYCIFKEVQIVTMDLEGEKHAN